MVREQTILSALPKVLKTVEVPGLGKKYQGKVRDFYKVGDKRLLITTDRQSAFDVILGHIPFKGAVLNRLSQFWFEQTRSIVANHMIDVIDPNVMIARECTPIPVEMVVRGYISGVTKTSIWYSYERGERAIYGIRFPDGLVKNQKLPAPVITPTTHPEAGSSVHDERLTRGDIIRGKLVTKKLYEQMERVALALFAFGSRLCRKHGLILVDTKYEFGLQRDKLMLIDEIHTPDSSRFWIADTYRDRMREGQEPENFDKEFLRLWYASRGYRGDGPPPPMPHELVVAVAKRYIGVYEKITGKTFRGFPYPIEERITKAVASSLLTATGDTTKLSLTYSQVGDDYDTKDPLKVYAQKTALPTRKNLRGTGITEVSASRGESAYVIDMGVLYGAVTIEGLGTKNCIADILGELGAKKTYYDNLGIDTVATIVNDLVTVGARPLVVSPHWALGDNKWLDNPQKFRDLVAGWAKGCNLSGAVYGGGETPTLKGIVNPGTVELSGSAFGIIKPKTRLVDERNLTLGDAIVLIESSGIHTNGLSLARAIAAKVPGGYATRLPSGRTLGEALLTPSHIYAKLVDKLFSDGVRVHYLVHITGHGWRKLMRAKRSFTYRLHEVPPVPEELTFLASHGPVSTEEMYGTFNMGAGFAVYAPEREALRVTKIAAKLGFKSWIAGTVEKGRRQVVIPPLGLVYHGASLRLK